MKRRDLIRRLEKLGAVLIRHGAKHDWFQNPATKMAQPVPRHAEITNGSRRASFGSLVGREVSGPFAMNPVLLLVPIALICGCAHQPAANAPAPVPAEIDFSPHPWPQVWTSLHDEFVKEVEGCKPWLDAPAVGLEPKFVLHGGMLQELSGELGLPKDNVVVPLDEAARLQLLALLRDDTPVKNEAKEWADGGRAWLSLAMEFLTVTVLFEKQEYRYTIDPIFGLVDVSIGGRPELYTDNLPLAEKFVELCARQMRDDRVKIAVAEARRRTYAPEAKK